MRSVSRIAAVILLAAGMAGAATAAHATEPIPSFVEYSGEGSTVGGVSGGSGGGSGPYPVTAKVDCGSGECVFTGTMFGNGYDWDLTQGQRLVLVDGHGEFSMSEWGDVCSGNFWATPGPMVVDADADGISIVRSGSGTANGPCLGEANGTTTVSFTATISGTVSGGDPCVIDRSCPIAAPVVSPGQSGADDPGTLSTLPTVADAARPANILWAVGLTVVLVLLVAFPAHLLNTAAEHGSDRVGQWWGRVRRRASNLPAVLQKFGGWPVAAAGVVVASLISAFVDPRFGLDPLGSLRIFGSILLAFVVDVAVGWALVLLFLRRTTPDVKAHLRFAPASLLLVVAAVLFSRVTGFQPGIVFGLVAGVVIGATLATAQRARVALLGLGYSFVVGVLSWIVYAIVSAAAGDSPSVGVLFVQETLSAIAIGGIAVLPIALFPLRGMTGFDIFSWNKVIWAAAYAVGLVGFFFVLMPMPFAWEGVPLELGVWIGLYLAYAIAAVAIWALVTRPWQKEKAAA
ncbi:MAG: hypothetical protein ABI566_07785 [Pseudolysinimonas sp.]